MKRKFSRSLAGIMAVCMFALMSSGFTFSEVRDEGYTEVTVCCEVDDATTQAIIDTINGEKSTYRVMTPRSILCIFGHNMVRTTAIEINHNFWSTSPRCRETIWRVDYCIRNNCSHMVMTQVSQLRITCC
jgi:hypothetical protein